MPTDEPPRVAFFRPDDERTERAREVLTALGAEPVSDPMLAIEPTGAAPRTDADYLILTSKTGVECVVEADIDPGEVTVCAIGEATGTALEDTGIGVDVVPESFTSRGLVDRLADEVAGRRIEIARSDHGSPELPEGLVDAGAYVHETVLYELIRPPESGRSVGRMVAGDLDALLFTSSLTVEHFLEAAAEQERVGGSEDALDRVTIGAIGPPTARTAESVGIGVDVVASRADFETLARETLAQLPQNRTI